MGLPAVESAFSHVLFEAAAATTVALSARIAVELGVRIAEPV